MGPQSAARCGGGCPVERPTRGSPEQVEQGRLRIDDELTFSSTFEDEVRAAHDSIRRRT